MAKATKVVAPTAAILEVVVLTEFLIVAVLSIF
jgi:hypothetical protein